MRLSAESSLTMAEIPAHQAFPHHRSRGPGTASPLRGGEVRLPFAGPTRSRPASSHSLLGRPPIADGHTIQERSRRMDITATQLRLLWLGGFVALSGVICGTALLLTWLLQRRTGRTPQRRTLGGAPAPDLSKPRASVPLLRIFKARGHARPGRHRAQLGVLFHHTGRMAGGAASAQELSVAVGPPPLIS